MRPVVTQPRCPSRTKPSPSALDDGLGRVGPAHDLARAVTVCDQRHDLGAPDTLLHAVPVGYDCCQLAAVIGAQFELISLVHVLDSYDRVIARFQKRTHTSDLVY